MFAWTSPRMPRTGGGADRHGPAAARPRATGRFRRRRRIRLVMLGAAAMTEAAEGQVALAGRPPRLATRLGTGPHVPELGVTRRRPRCSPRGSALVRIRRRPLGTLQGPSGLLGVVAQGGS